MSMDLSFFIAWRNSPGVEISFNNSAYCTSDKLFQDSIAALPSFLVFHGLFFYTKQRLALSLLAKGLLSS
jgi:hypothetical protein